MTLPSSILELERKYAGKIVRLDDYAPLMSTHALGDREIYDWFPYMQRFTSKFLRKIFQRKELTESRVILDPFMGSGNTLVACLEHGKVGYGVDISPLFWFITHVKTSDYSEADFKAAVSAVRKVKELADIDPPCLTSFQRLFSRRQLNELLTLREAAYNLESGPRQLLLFALAAELLKFSRAKRYGKGLHIKPKRGRPLNVRKTIISKIERMGDGFAEFRRVKGGKIFPLVGDAREMRNLVDLSSNRSCRIQYEVDAVLTSPPYCNSSDYVEMYKLEHWFLRFINTYEEFRRLSYSTIRSHTTILSSDVNWKHPVVEDICSWLESRPDLWNRRIPSMIRGYFDDLHTCFQQMTRVLRPNATVIAVVGNSCYSTAIPTDVLVADMAVDIGFRVERVEVIRQLPTSGQQWAKLDLESKRLLRESIVVLRY